MRIHVYAYLMVLKVVGKMQTMPEFLRTTIDKFTFLIATDRLYTLREHGLFGSSYRA